MDLGKLSDTTLEEIVKANGQLSALSDAALEEIAGQGAAPSVAPSEENKSWTQSQQITQDELNAIAQKHGAAPATLQHYAKGIGADVEGIEAEPGMGLVSEGLLMGIPRKLASFAEDEPTRKAIDEVVDLWHKKRSYGSAAAELGAGMLTPGGVLFKTAKAAPVAKAAGMAALEGGVFGVAGGFGASKTGEEAQSAAIGGAIGAAAGGTLAVAAEGVARLLAKRGTREAAKVSQEITQEAPNLIEQAMKRVAEEAPATDTQFGILKDMMQRQPIEGDKLPEFGTVKRMFAEVADDPELEDVVMDLASRTTKEMPGEMDVGRAKERIYQDFENTLMEFGDFIRGGTGPEGKRLGSPEAALRIIQDSPQELLEKEWDQFLLTRRMTDDMARDMAPKLGAQGAMGPVVLTRALLATRSVFSMVDSKIPGLNLTGALDDFSRQNKLYTVALKGAQQQARPISNKFAKLTAEQKEAVYAALDTHAEDFSDIGDAAVKEVATEYRRLFDGYREDVNRVAGYELIKKNDAYVPYMAFAQPKGASRITERVNLLKQAGLDLLDPELNLEKIKEFYTANKMMADETGKQQKTYDLINEVFTSVDYYWSNEQKAVGPLAKGLDMLKFRIGYADVLKPRAVLSPEQIAARASFRRTGNIPELIKQKDLVVLADNWASNSLRAAHLAPALKEIQRGRNVLLALGDETDAAHVTDLLTDLTGRREGTLATHISDVFESWKSKMLQEAAILPRDSKKRRYLEGAAEMDRLFNGMLQQAYPNFLGLHNPRAAIQNLLSPALNTVPEVGNAYGMTKLLSVSKSIGSRLPTLKAELQARGFKGAEWSTELRPVMQDALMDSVPWFRGATDKLQKVNDLLMSAFSASETINIAFAVDMGEAIARDAFGETGSWATKQALKAVDRMPAGIKAAFKAAREAGDIKECQRIMSEHLVAKTVLNYDRANMASAARAAGPLLSMFTRWPTAIAGDIAEQYVTKGAAKGTEILLAKYIGPMVFLAGMNTAVVPELRDFLTGEKGDFTQYSPLQSVTKAAAGKQGAPLALQPAKAAGQAIAGDFDAAGKTLLKFGQGVVPLAGPISKIITATMDEKE